MSSINKSIEINLNDGERELLENAIRMCKEIVQNFITEDGFK